MVDVENLHGVDEVMEHDFKASSICGVCGSNVVKGRCSKCNTKFEKK